MADVHDQPKGKPSDAEFLRLAAGLSSVYMGPARVPHESDAAMRRAIVRHYQQVGSGAARRFRWRTASWAAVSAAAAMVAVVLWIGPFNQRVNQPAIARHQSADLDSNGRIDILDAFALARQIEAAAHMDSAFDLNSDGKVDSRDVDAIAMQAVSLGKEASS